MSIVPLLCFFAATLLAGVAAYSANRILLPLAVMFLAAGFFFTTLGSA